MSPIFLFDDDTSIIFNIDAVDTDLRKQITDNGGTLTDKFDNTHFVVGTQARIPGLLPSALVVNRNWATDCISEGVILPMYEYVDAPAENSLRDLRLERRDQAELLKFVLSGDHDFTRLHRKLPHNTSRKWREIYQSLHRATLEADPQMAHNLEIRMDQVVLQFLNAYLPVSPPDLRHPRELENAPHALVDEQNGGGIELLGIQSEDEADTNAGDPQESVERASEGPDPAQLQAGAIDSPGDEGDKGGEGSTEGSTDSDTLPLSGMPTRGVIFTPEDHNAMVKFVKGLDHKPRKADWKTFWSWVRDQYWAWSMAGTDMRIGSSSLIMFQTGNQKRSADAWRRQYDKKRKWINAEVHRLGSQGLSREE